MKDFFQSSTETLSYNETENIFLTQAQKGKGYVEVTFNPDKDGAAADKTYMVKISSKNTYVAGDTSIRDAVKLKSFLTYKHLPGIHYIKKDKEIDLFDLLVKGVLKHFKSVAITGNKELGELWDDVEAAIAKETGQTYNMHLKSWSQRSGRLFFRLIFARGSIPALTTRSMLPTGFGCSKMTPASALRHSNLPERVFTGFLKKRACTHTS